MRTPPVPPPPSRFAVSFGFVENAAHVLCRTADYYMQMTSRAKLRQRLDLLLDEHRHLLEVAFERTPLGGGIVHESPPALWQADVLLRTG